MLLSILMKPVYEGFSIYLETNPILYVGLREVIKRGTAEITKKMWKVFSYEML